MTSSGPSDELRRVVEAAAGVFMSRAYTSQDELLQLLRGIAGSAGEAWRLLAFVPMAFCHVVMKSHGVRFQDTFISMTLDGMTRARRELKSEPVYVASIACAERMVALGCPDSQLQAVYGISGEYAAIQSVIGPRGELDKILLTEPVVFQYEA